MSHTECYVRHGHGPIGRELGHVREHGSIRHSPWICLTSLCTAVLTQDHLLQRAMVPISLDSCASE